MPAERAGVSDERPVAQLPPLEVPEWVRPRLAQWIDVGEVGAAGFWAWLETMLALLGPAAAGRAWPKEGDPSVAPRVRELARDLVDCARDRARLTVLCDHYFSDNQVLARRVMALEGMLRTAQRAGRKVRLVPDPDASQSAERYLPQG